MVSASRDNDEAAREVAAMQFAGGYSMLRLAAEWERSVEWVERAIRDALLESIPVRAGGMKMSRTQWRAARAAAEMQASAEQWELQLGTRD